MYKYKVRYLKFYDSKCEIDFFTVVEYPKSIINVYDANEIIEKANEFISRAMNVKLDDVYHIDVELIPMQ